MCTLIMVKDGVDGDKDALVDVEVKAADVAVHEGSKVGEEHESLVISADKVIGEFAVDVLGKFAGVKVEPVFVSLMGS